jgi:hypothetical protein
MKQEDQLIHFQNLPFITGSYFYTYTDHRFLCAMFNQMTRNMMLRCQEDNKVVETNDLEGN